MKKIILIIIFMCIINYTFSQWTQTNLSSLRVYSLINVGNNIFAGTNGDGVKMTSDDGDNWNSLNIGLANNNVKQLAIIGSNIFAFSNTVYKSSNYGNFWSSLNGNLISFTSMVSIGGNIFAGSNGFFTSSDNGVNWTLINPITGVALYDISSLAVYSNYIFAGTTSTGGGVYLSTDYGNSWVKKSSGITAYNVYSLLINGNKIFAGTEQGVFESSDNGENWVLSIMLSDVNAFANIGNRLFASTGTGKVYMSNDNGITWSNESLGLPYSSIYSLTINGNNVFAATYDFGVWKRSLSQLGVYQDDLNNKPLIYFNPTNNKLQIIIQNNDLENTNLNIFDMQGRLILQQTIKQSQTEFYFSNFAKGIYVVKLINNKKTMESKFVKE